MNTSGIQNMGASTPSKREKLELGGSSPLSRVVCMEGRVWEGDREGRRIVKNENRTFLREIDKLRVGLKSFAI